MGAASGAGDNSPPPGPDSVEHVILESRCEVYVSNLFKKIIIWLINKLFQPGGRRGTVMYKGLVPEISAGGYWVGVKFDEPVGLCDGSSKGTTYFECGPKYGSFVRGSNIICGDFPEVDPFADLEDDDEI